MISVGGLFCRPEEVQYDRTCLWAVSAIILNTERQDQGTFLGLVWAPPDEDEDVEAPIGGARASIRRLLAGGARRADVVPPPRLLRRAAGCVLRTRFSAALARSEHEDRCYKTIIPHLHQCQGDPLQDDLGKAR
jgi:hypothetical protein